MKIGTELQSVGGLESGYYNRKVDNNKNSFESFFDAALDLLNETNIYQLDLEQRQLDYITGKSDDIIGLNMAQGRASASIQFTTQVTNKVLTAYQEIMRLQL